MLVLDEATSALDTRTEKIVMEAINSLSESLTVIMITHRLSTIECCDRAFGWNKAVFQLMVLLSWFWQPKTGF